MSMSKQDYEVIAKVIRAMSIRTPNLDPDAMIATDSIAFNLAVEFKKSNPNFDRERFLEAALHDYKAGYNL